MNKDRIKQEAMYTHILHYRLRDFISSSHSGRSPRLRKRRGVTSKNQPVESWRVLSLMSCNELKISRREMSSAMSSLHAILQSHSYTLTTNRTLILVEVMNGETRRKFQ